MRPRPDDLLRAAGAGGAGVIWGLGLARLLAEAGFWPLLYSSPSATVGVAVVCATMAIAFGAWVKPNVQSPPAPSSLAALIPLTFPLLYVVGIVSGPLAGGTLVVGAAVLVCLMAWGGRLSWTPPAVLGVATLALYLRTLLPTVGQADTFEFQVVVPLLRVAHPTGYPLYVLLGKLFTLLPLGSVAWRVNLSSAVFATGAVLMLYALLLRLTASRWLPAFLASLFFALSYPFWSQAVIAEVYTLHNLLVALTLWLLLPPEGGKEGGREPPPDSGDEGGTFLTFLSGRGRAGTVRRWRAIFLLVGLSLTNHLTTALLLPAVMLALLRDRPRLRSKEWLTVGGAFILGLSVYLFIPLRWPALNRGEWMTLREFASYISGGQFHGALRLDGWRDPVRWDIVGRLLRESFGWVGLGLAALGVARMAARLRWALALTGVTFLAFVVYGLDYYVPDISVFLLPAHLILAIWIGVGIAFLADLAPWIRHSGLSRPGHAARTSTRPRGVEAPTTNMSCDPPGFSFSHLSFDHLSFLILLTALLPLSRIWANLPAVDQSHNEGGYAWGQYTLSLPLAEGGAVLADVEKFAPLYYLQQIEGVRPDLDLVLLGSEELYYAELAERLEMAQTVYLARYLPHLEGLHLRSVGPLVEVVAGEGNGRWVADGGAIDKIDVTFGETIRLLGAQLRADPFGRAMYHLTLYWQAETRGQGELDRAVVDDLVIRLRLVDADGQVGWESEGVRPVGGLYPTNAWRPDVPISDYHEVPLAPWLPPGQYRLEVGLFPPFSGAGLRVNGGADTWLALGTLEVGPPSDPLPPLPYRRRICFDDGRWLTGYNMASEAPVAVPFTVDLSWHSVGVDGQVRLSWLDARQQRAKTAVFPLKAGALRSRHILTTPPSPGDYTLHVGPAEGTVRCGWLARPADDCPLAEVRVLPAQGEVANFANMILLLDAEVGEVDVRPGEIVTVALRWRAVRAMEEDYTIFVHLVGPDGRLHGQIDTWPLQGSHPTSHWAPGEELSDSYKVPLDPDAPPGRYQVQVGWYLLATMQRLQVLDTDGHPVGDSVGIGELVVAGG